MRPFFFSLDMEGLIYKLNVLLSGIGDDNAKEAIDYCVYAWFESERKQIIKEDFHGYMSKYGIDDIIPDHVLRKHSELEQAVDKLTDLISDISWFLADLTYEYNLNPMQVREIQCKWINHNLAVKVW